MGIPGVSRSFPQKETGKQVYFPCLAQAPEPVPRVVGLAAGSCLRVKESSLIFSSCLDLFTGKGQLEGRSVNPHRHPSAVAAQTPHFWPHCQGTPGTGCSEISPPNPGCFSVQGACVQRRSPAPRSSLWGRSMLKHPYRLVDHFY